MRGCLRRSEIGSRVLSGCSGQVSADLGGSGWRAGEGVFGKRTASRRHANRLRAQVDAILVGAETVRVDNPRLTVRAVRGARQPLRVVLSSSGRLPGAAHLFTDRYADRTTVLRNKTLDEAMTDLGGREVTSVLIEGGGDILAQALDARLIDRVQIYVGAVFTGGPVLAFAGRGAASTLQALRLRDISYEQIGHDVLVAATATYGGGAAE